MRNVIVGSFVGFVLAAAFLAACGGGSGPAPAPADTTTAELETRVAALETAVSAAQSALEGAVHAVWHTWPLAGPIDITTPQDDPNPVVTLQERIFVPDDPTDVVLTLRFRGAITAFQQSNASLRVGVRLTNADTGEALGTMLAAIVVDDPGLVGTPVPFERTVTFELREPPPARYRVEFYKSAPQQGMNGEVDDVVISVLDLEGGAETAVDSANFEMP